MTLVDSQSQASALQAEVQGYMNQISIPNAGTSSSLLFKQEANILGPNFGINASGNNLIQNVHALFGLNAAMSSPIGLPGSVNGSCLPTNVNVKANAPGAKRIQAPMSGLSVMPSATALDELQKTLMIQQQEHQAFLANLNLMAATKDKSLKRPHSSIGLLAPIPGALSFGIKNSLSQIPSANANPTPSLMPQIQATPQKKTRNGRRVCLVDGCIRFAQGKTKRCISHGGGKRCGHKGCPKSAYGSTKFCIAHGGGERCEVVGCTKSSQGSTKRCKAHGGGRRCKVENCPKSAQGSMFCKAHGGGKRCLIVGCIKQARGRSGCCISHSRLVKWN